MARIDIGLIKKKDFFKRDIEAKKRCDISEDRMEKALRRLKRRGLIVDYIKTSTIPSIDEQKIDFIVTIVKGAHYLTVGLNAKSSWTGVMKHNIAMEQKQRDEIENIFNRIPPVVINLRDSIEDLCVRILKKIS